MDRLSDRATFAPLPRRPSLWVRFWQLVGLRRQRHHLAALDDHLLADIGVTPAAARKEAARPVWDVPATWRD